jgi:uncharacterized protein (TIGR03083 family)
MSIDYAQVVQDEATALLEAAERGPLDASVAACPRWDLGRLAGHLGTVHRWATVAVTTRQEPEGAIRIGSDDDPVEWLREGIPPLVDALAGLKPDDVCWNFGGEEPGGAFWPRRMAAETAVHRWDGQAAVGEPAPIEPDMAADGVAELIEMWYPLRLAGRDGIDIGGSVHLHCTDIDGEWTFRTDDGVFRASTGHSKGDVAVRGPASALLLALWRRIPADDPALERFGDATIFDRFLALGAP